MVSSIQWEWKSDLGIGTLSCNTILADVASYASKNSYVGCLGNIQIDSYIYIDRLTKIPRDLVGPDSSIG